MAEKKPKKTITKKDDKLSPEEIRRRKEEVLKRINAEIGDEDDLDTPVIEIPEKEPEISSREVEVVEDKEEVEEAILQEDEKIGEDIEEDEPLLELNETEEKLEDKKDTDVQAVIVEEDIIEVAPEGEVEKEEDHGVKSSSSSPFSAAEFGLANNRKKGKNFLLFFIVFLIVAGISALVYYFYSTGIIGVSEREEVARVTPTVEPTATPSVVAFERSSLAVQVLNGSGTAGVAGDMQTFLEEQGYENIEVGNAEDFDYENITILIKPEYEDSIDEIMSDFEGEYAVNSKTETLADDSEYDLVVIVGVEAEEPEEVDE